MTETVEKTEATEKTSIRPNMDKYTKGRTATGAISHHSGDVVASNLEGTTVDEVASIAVELTGDKDLATKYEHLNVGMQRMNLGNKIRGGIAAIDKANEKEIAKAVKEAGEGADADEIAEDLGLVSGEEKFLQIVAPVREAVDARLKEAEEEKARKQAEREEKAKAKAAAKEAESDDEAEEE